MLKPSKKIVALFYERQIPAENGCHEWTGPRHERGYGLVSNGGLGNIRAHRLSYIISFGPIPDGLCVLHKCDNPACVNPSHLFLGTQRDNMRDAQSKGRLKNGLKVAMPWIGSNHCMRGHKYTEQSTGRHKTGGRYCLICMRNNSREYQRRKRALANREVTR